jgi:hypothetical protein
VGFGAGGGADAGFGGFVPSRPLSRPPPPDGAGGSDAPGAGGGGGVATGFFAGAFPVRTSDAASSRTSPRFRTTSMRSAV